MAGIALILNTSPVRPAPTPPPTITADEFCACDFRCDFEEKVFASLDDIEREKDFSDFLVRKISSADTVVIELFRYGSKVAEINDNSLGDFFNGFTLQPLYVGWLADWTKIFNAFSGGQYQVKITTNLLGQQNTFESRFFRLALFDEELANRTVKIESIQNGNIIGSEFDFTGLNWKSSIRLRGEFGKMQPTIEQDIFIDSSYRQLQNRDQIVRQYELSCEIIPETIFFNLASKDMLANDIFITTYKLLQDQSYTKYPVVVDSFQDTNYKDNGRMNFSIIFKDRQQNLIKRNF